MNDSFVYVGTWTIKPGRLEDAKRFLTEHSDDHRSAVEEIFVSARAPRPQGGPERGLDAAKKRGRANIGRMHTDPQWVNDPYPIWDDLRARCPVAHTDRYGGA